MLHQQGRWEEAIASYQQALAIQPDAADAYYNLGSAFHEQGNLEEAIAAYQQAITLQPNYAEAFSNLGLVFYQQGKWEEAIAAYQQAIAFRPNLPDTHYTLGLALYEQCRLEEAIVAYQQALILQPNFPNAHLSLSISLLHLGNYLSGWEQYEWRLKVYPERYNLEMGGIEKWDGTLPGNHEIILVEEQGLGDIIQFMRYGRTLKESFPIVSIAVKENLCKLIEMTGIYDNVYPLALTKAVVSFEAKWIPILSVPGILAITDQTSLINDFYVKVDQSKTEHWRKKINASSSLVVGINWQGNPQAEKKDFKGRSFGLSEYAPVAKVTGVQLISLQKGYGSEQLATCAFLDKFVECQEEINQTWDFVETVAIIQNCDLVITSDTFIAHLACAMGKPTWILLKKVPDWRWGLKGEQCPWYSSARLFRQTQSGNWGEVMERVRVELTNLVNSTCSKP